VLILHLKYGESKNVPRASLIDLECGIHGLLVGKIKLAHKQDIRIHTARNPMQDL
jgi:hypothetical protein